MSERLDRFDAWLSDTGPAALTLREHLMPVEGRDGVFFPSTFAASEDGKFKGGYNIDELGDGRNVCLVDSVGSQANRIESIFVAPPYSGLVPQIAIRAGDHRVNLLEAGHRAGDAIARCADGLSTDLRAAFQAVLTGNVEPLAKLAPTSVVFGAWDSRETQAKLPRLLASAVRAYDVRPLTRSAQYVPAIDYVAAGVLEEPADKAARDRYAERGFVHVPASRTHGGVVADGVLRRDATLHLVAVRRIASSAPDRTQPLQRYILGLALAAFTAAPSCFLRQGCNLVLDPAKPRELSLVWPDGRRDAADISHAMALDFAKAAAAAFGVDPDRSIPSSGIDRDVEFSPVYAAKDVSGEGKDTPKRTKRRAASA